MQIPDNEIFTIIAQDADVVDNDKLTYTVEVC